MVFSDVVSNFVNSYIPHNHYENLRFCTENLVYPTTCDIEEWLAKQPTNVRGLLDPCVEAIFDMKTNIYDLSIKKQPKPPLQRNELNTYSSLQTILAHSKDINALFCPIFKILRQRFISLLDPRFIIFTDMSPSAFEKRLSTLITPYMLSQLFKLEADISKFDKSQGKLILRIETEIYRLLGLPEVLISLWINAHEHTVLRDRTNGINAFVDYQKKSGDASTFFGNTLVTMLVIIICTMSSLLFLLAMIHSFIHVLNFLIIHCFFRSYLT